MDTIEEKLGQALLLHRQGELQAADAHYRAILAEHPEHGKLQYLLGTLRYQIGDLTGAESLLKRALLVDPENPEAQANLALVLQDSKRLDEALIHSDAAVRLAPENPDFLNNRAALLCDRKHYLEAIPLLERLVEAAPDFIDARINLGYVLTKVDRLAEAEAIVDHVLLADPAKLKALAISCELLSRAGRFAEAAARVIRVLEIDPADVGAKMSLGYLFIDRGLDSAFDRLIAELTTQDADRYTIQLLLAQMGNRQNNLADATQSYRAVLANQPDIATAHWNLALLLLLQGQFDEGFREYDWRFHPDCPIGPHAYKKPEWDGRQLHGERVLIHGEQGFGDVIQFIRYLKPVQERGADVIFFDYARAIFELLAEDGVDGEEVVSQDGEAAMAAASHEVSTELVYDYQVPLLSLPKIFGTTVETIPWDGPYLHPTPTRLARWRERIGSPAAIKVGVVWAGNPNHKNDHNRSCRLEDFAPLARIPGIRWYALQKGVTVAQAWTAPEGMEIDVLVTDIKDFSDTMAAIANLDLVISVDTSVVHLAGAMGAPVWTLLAFNADWRWMIDRDDSPWYPTMRLFRQQSFGDWPSAFAQIERALVDLVASNSTRLSADERAQFEACCRDGGPGTAAPQADTLHGFVRSCDGLIEATNHAAAAEASRAAITRWPKSAEPHYQLGRALQRQGDEAAAMACYRQALAIDAGHTWAMNNLGVLLSAKGEFAESDLLLQRLIRSHPNHGVAWGNLGRSWAKREHHSLARLLLEHALELRPDLGYLHQSLGTALFGVGEIDEAIKAFRHAIELGPPDANVFAALGATYWQQDRFSEAEHACRQAIDIDPENVPAHMTLCWCYLPRGDYRRGWPAYEWRLKQHPDTQRRILIPRWDGTPLNGRRLLVHTEQGFGDGIQFLRFMDRLNNGPITLECQDSFAPVAATCPWVSSIILRSEFSSDREREFDLHIPLMSLPLLLGVEEEHVAMGEAYLHPPAAMVTAWSERLASAGGGFRVGLAWAGNPNHKDDRKRSCSLVDLAPLAEVPGVTFYSLQKGGAADEVMHPPAGMHLVNLDPHLESFLDTAAVIMNLDLVIAVDTAVAHLAGALGRPVWTMLPTGPDWRWLLDRDDSPWYPSMRLFRQTTAGDWAGVAARMQTALIKIKQRPTP